MQTIRSVLYYSGRRRGDMMVAKCRTVRVDGGLTVGVLQGSNLSLTLFNILLEVAMAVAFKRRRTRSKNRRNSRIFRLRFVDDISLLTESKGELQQLAANINRYWQPF